MTGRSVRRTRRSASGSTGSPAGSSRLACWSQTAWRRSRGTATSHLEAYLAIPCMGAVLHTLNLRLFAEQLEYIVNHADDKVIIVDDTLIPMIGKLADKFEDGRALDRDRRSGLRHVAARRHVIRYEELLAAQDGEPYDWPEIADDRRPRRSATRRGTTGQPEGRPVLHRSAVLHSVGAAGRDSLSVGKTDRDAAGRADVPRQCVGSPLRGRDVRAATWSCPAASCRRRRSRTCWSSEKVHDRRRRADDLDRPAALLRRAQAGPVEPADRPLRRRGGAALADGGVPGAPRRVHLPGLGHDRDLAARLGRAAAARSRSRARSSGRYRTTARARSARWSRSQLLDDDGSTCSRGTASRPVRSQIRGPWIASGYYNDDDVGRTNSTTAGCAPATSPRSTPQRLHPHHRPREGRDQVRRRVDLLGRAGERDHGPPEGARGGGDRQARRALDRAPARVRRARGRVAERRGDHRAPQRQGRALVDPRRGARSSTRSRRPRSASSTRRCCASASRTAS